MSYWTEDEPTAAVLKTIISDFESETGIDVEVTWQGRDLPDTLAPLLATSSPKVDLVDFFCFEIAGRILATGKAADLSDVLTAKVPGTDRTVEESLLPATIPLGQKDGQTFCIPWELYSNFDIWFNAAKYPELVDNPPATWDEFIALAKKLGPNSIALDGSIDSYAQAWFLDAVISQLGAGGMLEAAADKTGEALKQPAMRVAAEKVRELIDDDLLTKGYNASKFPAEQQKWANNDAAFLLVGSWIPAETAPYAAPGFKPRAFRFPAVGSGGGHPMQVDVIGFGAIAGSPNLDAAKKFIAFVLQDKYQSMIGEQEISIPAASGAKVGEVFTGVQASINDPTSTVIRGNDGITVDLPGWNEDVLTPLAQKLANGDLDVDEFMEALPAESKAFWDNN